MASGEAFAAVLARLRSSLNEVDRVAALHGPQVTAVARVLGDVIQNAVNDVDVGCLIGSLYWLRTQLLAGRDGPDDRTKAIDALSQAISLLTNAAAPSGSDHDHTASLSDLSIALYDRYERIGDLADLSAAVVVAEAAVVATPTEHPDRARYLSNVCVARRARYTHADDLADLDAAIAAGEAAVVATPVDHPDRAEYLSNICVARRARFDRIGDARDLVRAFQAGEAAVAASAADNPDRAGYLGALSLTWHSWFDQTANVTDVDHVIRLGEAALAATPQDDPARARRLSNLASARLARFERLGDLVDLDRAIEADDAAVAATLVGHPDRARYLSNLGLARRARFHRTGDLAELTLAIAAGEAAAVATSSEHAELPGTLSNLGIALRVRFEQTGEVTDLARAIEVGQAAVTATPADHPDRAMYLSNLGIAFRVRFERTGEVGDLAQAIDVGELAVTTTTTGSPNRSTYLATLGIARYVQYEHGGDSFDLTRAVETADAAVAATPSGHPGRAARLTNLANALHSQFTRTGDPRFLESSIDAYRRAVAVTPPGHPDRAGRLSNLAIAYHTRYLAGDRSDPEDLDQAVEVGESAVAATPIDHPDRRMYLSNLGVSRRVQFERTGEMSMANVAVEVGEAALAATPTDHPDRAIYLSQLAAALQARFDRAGDVTDLNRAVAALRDSLVADAAPPVVRARCGAGLARLLADQGQWVKAAQVWEQVLRLLPQVINRALSWRDRQYKVAAFSGVGTGAAATALAGADVDRAWEWLEQGRALMLGQALDTVVGPSLRHAHPALAARLDRLRRQLGTELPDLADPATIAEVTARRRLAARDWDPLIDRIRREPGFERYGSRPSIDDLRDTVGDNGVIVAINITRWRCDALVLTSNGSDVCPLPSLTMAEATRQADAFLAAVTSPWPKPMRDVLVWLWDVVVGPVLRHLGRTQPGFGTHRTGDEWPRVWWLPTGPLSVLPMHAAISDAGEATLDRVISSYAPTVRVLSQTRPGRTPPQDRRALVVGVDDAPGHPPLRYASIEAREVSVQLATRTRPLVNNEATLAAVRGGLVGTTWAHFACHGVAAPDPAESHLVLYDGRLTVREIANLNLGQAHVAFLSACGTAFGGTELVDESIHIASAFQLAGFAHVIATLWVVRDLSVRTFANVVYKQIIEGVAPASATHHAVRALRDDHPDHPALWAPYIHVGL
jgi:tetratricopeptide (TPR) repeat protein